LSLAASRLAEEEEKRRQESELSERYAAALELLGEEAYAQAIEALEQIVDQAPGFQDAGEMIEKARAGLEKARLYKAALAKLAEGCPDEACAHLLALLKLDPDHADAHARLPEAVQGVLAELEEVGGENEALCARAGDLETQLAEAQATLKKLETETKQLRSAMRTSQAWVETYDSLLLAMEDDDQNQMLALARKLTQAKLAGAKRLLTRLQAERLKPRGDLWTNPQDGKEMVRVPAGEFLYGDKKNKVELPEFWIDRTPVTNAEYARFVAATGHSHRPPKHWKGKNPPKEIVDHPVIYVSWHDAVAYAEWAGKRLPTEEEWEKAARGTDGREYPWGRWQKNHCNTKEASVGGTTPVGLYSPDGDSPFGCMDMAGNVWEWVAVEEGDHGAVRGGSWNENRDHARCAARNWSLLFLPDLPLMSYGFRCVSPV
jgi:formylglycine-generating enzyme required for sulfatase activity